MRQGERGHGRSYFHSDWRTRLLHAGWYVDPDDLSEALVRIIRRKLIINANKESLTQCLQEKSEITYKDRADVVHLKQQFNMIQFRYTVI